MTVVHSARQLPPGEGEVEAPGTPSMAGSLCLPLRSSLILFSKGRLRRMIIPETLRRKQVARVLKAKQRPGTGSTRPGRLTSCIFKSPITRVTAHLGNVVQHWLAEGYLEKAQQVCALRRLQGLRASSSEGEPLPTLEFANSWKMTAPAIPSRSASPAGAGWMQSRPEPTPEPASKGSEIPPADLGVSGPLSSWQVTPEDIERQTRKGKELRRRLAEALQEDKVIREEEKAGRGD
ncbi:LOW QUALITY PROTEIN: methyl-CpG-binding domain protein 3-like 2B [Lepus europaeus]|uniref:LOW QUALITY PROTEIN: methyl-CpG-binding domain protein 3-like 2B n=1 Tax=Lepus europaeus TaxID=9983 RepID=UPI002B49A78C|nr:LOW QUALITY PROTEIN: methyl-CpG-binding domain protein 3-like 2B [Lepus europaeus]